MTANQIPYDQLDWLQIAIYFVALPIVAFLGAAIGLLGRWRRGGMLWSTNVGLLGGAVACLILAIGLSTLEGESITNYFGYFEKHYRWMMLSATLGCTTVCAWAAAISWRFIHEPREKQPFALSLQSIMLVQLFAFISMGSFIGLRLFMLQHSDNLSRYEIPWSAPGWTFDANNRSATFDAFSLTPQDRDSGLSAKILSELAEQKNVTWVLLNYDAKWEHDLSPLLQSKTIRAICFNLSSSSPSLLAQLSKSRIKQQSLMGDLRNVDLSMLGQSSSVETLILQGIVSPVAIESLSEVQHFKQLMLMSAMTPVGDRAVLRWPKNIEKLNLFMSVIGPRDFDSLAGHEKLTELSAPDIAFDVKAITAISSIPNLRLLNIGVGKIDEGGYSPLEKFANTRVDLHVLDPEFTLRSAHELKRIRGLSQLELSNSLIDDEILNTLADIDSLEYLTVASPKVTQEAVLALAKMPRLLRLSIPNTLLRIPLEAELNAKRKSLGLPNLQVMAVTPIVPLKTIIVK